MVQPPCTLLRPSNGASEPCATSNSPSDSESDPTVDRGPRRSGCETAGRGRHAGGGSGRKGVGFPVVPPIAYWRESARTISILAALCCIQYNISPTGLL
jgi:hypothetical protein